ncbi:hypothetical protein E2C01_053555 [Portunus trituberculatus]|uniref:Uncharacterized protein n=1 Tax=Portunus trituberculatus TaxID=210409 RepID=A0A5B7GPN7_PORTR|nr:hypothetical protein [Portunus trituberculatus]
MIAVRLRVGYEPLTEKAVASVGRSLVGLPRSLGHARGATRRPVPSVKTALRSRHTAT